MSELPTDPLAALVKQKIDEQFKTIESDARKLIDSSMANLRTYQEEIKAQMENLSTQYQNTINKGIADWSAYQIGALERLDQRTKEVEERVTREVRTKVFAVAAIVVTLAAGALLVGSFTATREVNASVISLQKDIIAAQTSVTKSSEALIVQRDALATAQAAIKTAVGELSNGREQLKLVTGQLDKAKAQYEALSQRK